MGTDFDWSEFNSRNLGYLIFDRESSLLPYNAHRSPVEIFSEIFLYTVQADPRSRTKLMLVCRHWHDIMLSTPGIHSQLGIYRLTKKKDVERFGRRWLLDVTVEVRLEADDWYYRDDSDGAPDDAPDDAPDGDPDFNPVKFHACFMAAAEAASRWRSLTLLSLPASGKYKDLQIMHPLQHLESFKLAENCHFGNFLEPLLSAITTTVTPRFTVMEVFNPDAVPHLLQPAHFQNFSSLTTLKLICRRMQDPVDVLPSLHKLEILDTHHLFLPIYPPGVDLPLTQTLRVLHLKSVSVQWMTGQIFPALEECSIIFPHHSDAIHSVDMPSCSILKYDSNNLSALEHFHISSPDKLEINCGQWRTWSGDLQLICLRPIFAAQSLTCLHLEIKCSERLLSYMLGLVPALEELWMRLSSPHALSTAFFLTLAAGGHKANAASSIQTIIPLGRNLRMLHLHYKRWLRGPERNALIPAFGAVVASHLRKERFFVFQLCFFEGPKLQNWDILKPVERFDGGLTLTVTFISVSSPYGIVPLSRALVDGGHRFTESEYLPLLCEMEYVTIKVDLVLPIEFLFSFHSLKEVRMPGLSLGIKPDTQFSCNAPLFHSLRVLDVWSISSSFFAGHTFHKLERYKEGGVYNEHIPGQGPLTEMPVCTRAVASPNRLATLKRPQIHELGLYIGEEPNHIWMKHIAVNTNLSGLRLLHLQYAYRKWPTIAVIKILGSLPALETLIIGHAFLTVPIVNFFEAFVPMNVPGPSALNQSNWKGQISGVLCPTLECLHIEGICLTEQAELVPVLKDIVTLRAIIGSPLKSFTFYSLGYSGPQMWQLIGGDKCFITREVPAQRFQLDI